jgi:hypothetical protein
VHGYKIKQEMEKYSRSVLEREFDEANEKIPEDKPLDIKEVSRITNEIYFRPSRTIEIIKLMRQRFSNSPS